MPQNLNSDKTVGVDGFVKWSDKVADLNYFVGVNATLARQMNGKRYGECFLMHGISTVGHKKIVGQMFNKARFGCGRL